MGLNLKIFRNNVKYLIKSNGYTLQRFADILGISKSMVSAFNAGQSNFSLQTIIKISRLFNISIDDLIFKDLTLEG